MFNLYCYKFKNFYFYFYKGLLLKSRSEGREFASLIIFGGEKVRAAA